MFTKMGVPNGEMALFTSLLYLPWTIKPFWSPFVDIIKDQKMVDPFHADSDVCGIHPADAVHSTAGRGDYGGRNNPHPACSASR